MTKKVRRRTITADNGAVVKLVTVVRNGQIVDEPFNDESNSISVTSPSGAVYSLDLSAEAMKNTARWFNNA